MAKPRVGFSLIEILVVLLVIAIIAGIAFSLPRKELREAHVKAAAEALAATIRETRTRAMQSRAVYAIVFHIENAPGSSGRVLNNRSGGHWYRVLGPRAGHHRANQQLAYAPIFDRSLLFSGTGSLGQANHNEPENPLRPFLETVAQSWAGPVQQLPPGKVRFLALTDEDRGHYRAPGDIFPPTYPRPWFGHFDVADGRLYPWGGYDPDLPMVEGHALPGQGPSTRDRPRTKNGRTISHTGFYYEGYDGPIVDSVHPSDRFVLDDTNGDGKISFTGTTAVKDDLTAAARYRLWQAGDPRPVFDGSWGDFCLIFRPDGQVDTEWMPLRRGYNRSFWNGACYDPTSGSNSIEDVDQTLPPDKYYLRDLGPADRISRVVDPHLPGSHVKRTGFYWLTIAPDVRDDTDVFVDAETAIRSLTPIYRVGVSPFGAVRIIRVRTTPSGSTDLDTALIGDDWNDRTRTDLHYQHGTLTNADGTLRGAGPVFDRVLPEMLRERMWWWE